MTQRKYLKPILAGAALAPLVALALPGGVASAHGYVNSPPSRQAECAQGTVSCGDVTYEPQSVEGPKGLKSCSAGNSRFAELDDDSKGWVATPVGTSVDFTWTNTAAHRTRNWEYYIGDQQVAVVDGGNTQPGSTVTHTVDLSGHTGKQKVLAVWNIADTSNAFYSCIDLQIG
jgi:predicted carbohydrate-binding protein with CBM5 and CBM33 domain